MNYIVIYPGRFHPFHRGHKATYDYLTKRYGANSVYIATSDVQAPITSPFSFQDKVNMITKLGIPASHVVQVKNPYQATEITNSLSDEEKADTVLIFAVSEKDMAEGSARFRFGTKKNGEPSYLQPMPENVKQLKPMNKHAYVVVAPTVNFKVKGADADSAKQIRKLYIDGSDADRDNIITDLYGERYDDLRDIFDRKLGVMQKVTEFVYGAEIKDNNSMSAVAPLRREHQEKLINLLQHIKLMEQKVQDTHSGITEDLVEDYIEERWSQKYKRSIDCSRPRGFSQRAHCAGRKKK